MTQEAQKLVLGTVQLGLHYGINNQVGKPKKREALEILGHAYSCGLRILDTASGYGNAENVIGEFLHSQKITDLQIISKMSSNIVQPHMNASEVCDVVNNEIKSSITKLHINSLDGYMLHDPKDMQNESIIHALLQSKTDGFIEHIGVSIYEPEDALFAASASYIDYIQIPYNVLDQRLNKNKFFDISKQNEKKIFARSAFLQGLLLMEPRDIPKHLIEIKPLLEEFGTIANEHGFTKKEASLLFAYHNPDISYIVFGVESLVQLDENIDIVLKNNKDKFKKCYGALYSRFIHIDKSLISPNLWEQRK